MGLQTCATVRLDTSASAAEFETAAARPVGADHELSDGISWICNCVLEDSDTPVGVVSIYRRGKGTGMMALNDPALLVRAGAVRAYVALRNNLPAV